MLIKWLPKYYLFSWAETPNIYCIGIYSNGYAQNILGGIFMRGMDVIFDRAQQKIGFAHSDCDSSFIYTDYKHPTIPPKYYEKVSNSVISFNEILLLVFIAFILLVFFLAFHCKPRKNLEQIFDEEPNHVIDSAHNVSV